MFICSYIVRLFTFAVCEKAFRCCDTVHLCFRWRQGPRDIGPTAVNDILSVSDVLVPTVSSATSGINDADVFW
jgi:hypothetical protein